MHGTSKALAVIAVMMAAVLLAGCAYVDGDEAAASATPWSVTQVAGYFPSLRYLPPDELDRVLGPIADGDATAMTAALERSGAGVERYGLDNTTSIAPLTDRSVRAAWIVSILAPFGDVYDLVKAGRFDDIPPVPALDFSVREVATVAECRNSTAPWLHVTRRAFPPFPERLNNDSRRTFTEKVSGWLSIVADIERETVEPLAAWVLHLPRHSGTSDPMCFLDQETLGQRDGGADPPSMGVVTDFIEAGDIDRSPVDVRGSKVALWFLCDTTAGSGENPADCDETRARAESDLDHLGADATARDAGELFADVPAGDEPDRAAIDSHFAELSEDDITDLLSEPVHTYLMETN